MIRSLIEIITSNAGCFRQTLVLASITSRKKYKSTDLGWLWSFMRPVMYILVYYVAISIGFRHSKNIDGLVCPYFIWLAVGIVAFFYMRGMILGGSNCFQKNRLIIRNTTYPVAAIPFMTALSEMIVHVILMGGVFIYVMLMGVAPSIYWLQIPIYTALMLLVSTIWAFGAGLLTLLTKDFYNFLSSINMAFFWLSGILFNVKGDSVGEKTRLVMRFNPISYIVEGYRNAICRHIWIFEEPREFGCFMITLTVMLLVALFLYTKLKHRIRELF